MLQNISRVGAAKELTFEEFCISAGLYYHVVLLAYYCNRFL